MKAASEAGASCARRAHVSDGERVTLTTRRGSATFMVKVTRSIREDTVFVPFHWGDEQSANRLTTAAKVGRAVLSGPRQLKNLRQ